MKRYETAKELLAAHSSNRKRNGCIIWKGSPSIYTTYWARYYKVSYPHQLAYIIKHGDYTRDKHVFHKCGNNKCINPNHLYTKYPYD